MMSADFAVLEATEFTPETRAMSEQASGFVRRLPVGAEPQPEGGVHFRVWAPRVREIAIEIKGFSPIALQAEADGYYSGLVADARTGMRYGFRTDIPDKPLPDPAARFQPEGPHGPSRDHRSRDVPLDRPELARPAARGAGHLRDACR